LVPPCAGSAFLVGLVSWSRCPLWSRPLRHVLQYRSGPLTGYPPKRCSSPLRPRPPTCAPTGSPGFSTPGCNTDVEIKLCVFKSGSSHSAYGHIRWEDGGGAKKLDTFDLRVRLERHDATKDAVGCDYTSEINASSTGVGYSPGATSTSSGYGSCSADGYLDFGYDADGEGRKTWSLQGSPLIN